MIQENLIYLVQFQGEKMFFVIINIMATNFLELATTLKMATNFWELATTL